jgi:hypothetical protein
MIVYVPIFYYSITMSFTALFFLISELFPAVQHARVTTGIVYGIAEFYPSSNNHITPAT